MVDPGQSIERTEQVNGRGYFDSRGLPDFEEAAGIAVENDFAAGSADPRGKQGQDYMLWSIPSLIVVSLCVSGGAE